MSSAGFTRSRKHKRKSWRCFHCDEVFRSRKAAWAHFGPDDGCDKLPAGCVDPLRNDEAARLKELREAQDYALQCQENANLAEDKLEIVTMQLSEFKAITGCDGAHDLRMWLDSQTGRVVTANALIDGFRKAAPDLAEQIIG